MFSYIPTGLYSLALCAPSFCHMYSCLTDMNLKSSCPIPLLGKYIRQGTESRCVHITENKWESINLLSKRIFVRSFS
jgi:hypothetical protein